MDFSLLKEFMQYLSDTMVPGNSISIYLGGKQVFNHSTGYSDLEAKKPMTGNEYLNIYSCSKLTTVTAALQLLERGRFLVNDPLYDYIPEYKDMYVKTADGDVIKAKNHITIKHLFTMTAGFTYNFWSDSFKKASELTGGKMDTVRVIKCMAQDPLSFEPGTHWQYSLCHDVLAALVSVISGKKFSDYVKENIFEPLDMKNSFYHADDEIYNKMAKQYIYVQGEKDDNPDIVQAQMSKTVDGGVIKNAGKENAHILGEEYDSGGAGIITTVSDYSKLTAALANYGLGLTNERILAKGTVELLRTNALDSTLMRDFKLKHLAGYGYGYGVRTLIDKASSGSNGSIGEFGWGGAAGATALIDPKYNLGVFYAHHMKNPREDYYQPRLRNVLYTCLTQ